nr:MAG TPA: hypothetical protein [Caudoviricetes sp.]
MRHIEKIARSQVKRIACIFYGLTVRLPCFTLTCNSWGSIPRLPTICTFA